MTLKHFEPWSPIGQDVFDTRKAAHLLRRAGFGGTAEQVSRAVADGLEATVEGLFDEAADEEKEFGRTFEAIAGPFIDFDEVDQLRAWWVYRMVRTRVPLREKLTLFWHGHFATGFEKVNDARLMARQVDTIRRLAWGNFRDLVLAMAKDPAMLVWLDGESSTKAHPNENFARELMELFTCGIGHYTEADVQAAARAFTGWHRDGAEFVFHPDEHDPGRKTVPGQDGPVRRRRHHGPPDPAPGHAPADRRQAPPLLRLARARPRGDRRGRRAAGADPARHQVVPPRAVPVALLLLGPCYRKRISSPAEFAVGAVRTLGSDGPRPQVAEQMNEMGQALLEPPNVKGWDGETEVDQLQHLGRPDHLRPGDLPARERGPVRGEPRPLGDRPRHAQGARRGRRPPGRCPPPGRPPPGDPPGPGRLPPGRRRWPALASLPRRRRGPGQKTRALLALMLALPEYHAC